MSDIDLDDLLDEALDDLDVRLQKNEKKVQKKEEEINVAVEKAKARAAGSPLDMEQLMQSLLGSDSPDALNGLTSQLDSVVSMLDSSEDLSAEDKETLAKLKGAIQCLGDENYDEAMEKLQDLPHGNDIPPFLNEEPREQPESPSDATIPSEDMEVALTEALLKITMNSEMLPLLEKMAEAYPSWIKAHPDISAGDVERYTKQFEKSCQICELLKLEQSEIKPEILLNLLSELSDLGDLPEGLADFVSSPAELPIENSC